MKKLAGVGVAVVAVLLGTQARSGEKTKGLTPKDLAGVYKITAGEHGGKEIAAKELQPDRVTFTEDAVTVVDKDTKKLYAAAYKLMGGKIHMISLEPKKGTTADGLVKRDGDTLTLIYALPGGAAPTEFKTSAKQMMFTMKRLGKER